MLVHAVTAMLRSSRPSASYSVTADNAKNANHRLLKRKSMTGGMRVMTLFCCVRGGPFGLELAPEQGLVRIQLAVVIALIASGPVSYALVKRHRPRK